MGIKDKKICILWTLTEKSDFYGWFTKETIYKGDCLKMENLDNLQIYKGAWQTKGEIKPQINRFLFRSKIVEGIHVKCQRFMKGSQEIKYKCFLTFGPFLQNISFLKLQHFFLFSRPTYQVNSIFFSGNSNLQGSCYWWSILSSLATVTMKSHKISFSCFPAKYWNKFLQRNYVACQSKLCLEK